MKREGKGKTGGILLLVIGILLFGKVTNLFHFNMFFHGWWTLFIIIPNAVRFFSESGKQKSALKGLIIGILLLMTAQGFIKISRMIPLLFALFLMFRGYRMLKPEDKNGWNDAEKGERNKNAGEMARERREYYGTINTQDIPEADVLFDLDHDEPNEPEVTDFAWNEYANRGEYRKNSETDFIKVKVEPFMPATGQPTRNRGFQRGRRACTALFSGKEIYFEGEVFEGAMLSSVFGAITLDLRGATISEDTVIEAIALFGGIEIYVPANVCVRVNGNMIFGGVENHVKMLETEALYTIFVNVSGAFGGIEIK